MDLGLFDLRASSGCSFFELLVILSSFRSQKSSQQLFIVSKMLEFRSVPYSQACRHMVDDIL